MKNRMNLPAPLLAGLQAKTYDRGESDITVSQLTTPPRIAALYDLHRDEIDANEDAADMIWRVLGSAVHLFIEAASGEHGWLQEERFYKVVRGMNLGGQVDCYDPDTRTIYDFKVTSAWAVMDGAKQEWIEQQNCYAHLMRYNGYEVEAVKIVAILRDWSKNRTGGKYPEAQAVMLDLPMWEDSDTEAWISERVRLLQDNIQALAVGDKLTPCTDDEKWLRLRKGKPPEYARCKSYCGVAKWCDFWQNQVKEW